MTPDPRRSRRRWYALAAVPLLAALAPASAQGATPGVLAGLHDDDDSTAGGLTGLVDGLGELPSIEVPEGIDVVTDEITGSDGETYSVTNHLDTDALNRAADDDTAKEYLVVWAGDRNAADTNSGDLEFPRNIQLPEVPSLGIGPDFLAVVDATKGSPTYGQVVNTATVGPLIENEPHHMQYVWHKGDKLFAGGLFTDVTYVLDPAQLPEVSLTGVNLPTDTLCGSVPDAYWVTKDHKAYGTYMGGPDLPGPCIYSDGSVRLGNGFGGSPGEVVRLDTDGSTISEMPSATNSPETEQQCDNIPLLMAPTCANPHGIQAREDLDTLVTSDYNEPRNIILNPVSSPSSYLRRPTVRFYDISDRDRPELRSVAFLPDGPRHGTKPHHEEPRAAMEVTVTNQPGHKGAFAQTMQGGAIYYAPDMTVPNPQFQEVFDLSTANKTLNPGGTYNGAGSNGGWLQTSFDDRFLYHAVMGRGAGGLSEDDSGTPGYILKLDIRELLASDSDPQCSIDTLEETDAGGAEADCPAIVDVLPAPGGPHWGALDNFRLGADGVYEETDDPTRLAYANYFVARTGLEGDHRVCMVDIDPAGGDMALDGTFRDASSEDGCIDFDRATWPHGEFGPAKPHSMLFVVADDDVR